MLGVERRKWKFRYLGTTSVAVVLFLRHGSSLPHNVHGNNNGSCCSARSYHGALHFPCSKIMAEGRSGGKPMLAFRRSTRYHISKFGASINQKLGSKRNWKAANFRTSDRSFLGRLTVKRSLMQSHIRLMRLNKESLAVAGILREVMERHTPNVFSAVKL